MRTLALLLSLLTAVSGALADEADLRAKRDKLRWERDHARRAVEARVEAIEDSAVLEDERERASHARAAYRKARAEDRTLAKLDKVVAAAEAAYDAAKLRVIEREREAARIRAEIRQTIAEAAKLKAGIASAQAKLDKLRAKLLRRPPLAAKLEALREAEPATLAALDKARRAAAAKAEGLPERKRLDRAKAAYDRARRQLRTYPRSRLDPSSYDRERRKLPAYRAWREAYRAWRTAREQLPEQKALDAARAAHDAWAKAQPKAAAEAQERQRAFDAEVDEAIAKARSTRSLHAWIQREDQRFEALRSAWEILGKRALRLESVAARDSPRVRKARLHYRSLRAKADEAAATRLPEQTKAYRDARQAFQAARDVIVESDPKTKALKAEVERLQAASDKVGEEINRRGG